VPRFIRKPTATGLQAALVVGIQAEPQTALGRLQNIAKFTVTPEMRKTYGVFIGEFNGAASKRSASQTDELVEIAKQEQLQVLQPLIYQDRVLINVMDLNHKMSRFWGS
jgi:hypothetical protein